MLFRSPTVEREAARDRGALIDAKGDDANNANERIVEIRRLRGDE